MKKFFKRTLILLLLCFVTIASFLAFGPWQIGPKQLIGLPVPFPKYDKTRILEEYFLSPEDQRIFLQGKSDCGAFSSAYLLRNLGVEVYGEELYPNMEPKMTNGYLMPQALIKLFKQHGYSLRLCRGNLNALKNELTKNHPVLVVIGQGFAWQHYILLTGYDKEFIYTVDSLCGENPGTVMNKSYETEEFFRLWKNSLPVYNCLFFQLDEKNTPKNQMP